MPCMLCGSLKSQPQQSLIRAWTSSPRSSKTADFPLAATFQITMAISMNGPITILYHTDITCRNFVSPSYSNHVDLLMCRVDLEMGSPESFQRSDDKLVIPSTKCLKLKRNICQHKYYTMLVETYTALENHWRVPIKVKKYTYIT